MGARQHRGRITSNIMDKTYLKRSWISPKLKPGKSKIHGDGVLANEEIEAGEKLMEFGGEVLSKEEAFSGKYRSRSVWAVGKDLYIALPITDLDPSLDENLNHSCDANTWLSDEVVLEAKRDIKSGEEITLDQGTWNFEYDEYTDGGVECFCKSSHCRGRLTKNDWELPRLQQEYKNHFHPLIQDKINKQYAPRK